MDSFKFADEWVKSHKALLAGVNVTNSLMILISLFSGESSWTFDHLMIEMESRVEPLEAMQVIGIALQNFLFEITNGVITLVP